MSKIQSIADLAREIGIANRNNDLDRLNELESCFRATRNPGPLPLAPDIELNPDEVEVGDAFVESAGVLGLANALSRARRRVSYHRKRWFDFSRPVIVSEGDSWFQYPVRLDDVIDVLMEDYLLLSLGAAGDLISDMAAEGEYLSAIESEGADIFLISGGGNDMLHSGKMKEYLKPYEDGMDQHSVLHRGRWNQFRSHLKSVYSGIFHSVTTRFPAVTILCHGYDYALPRADGKWLGGPLAERGVPKELWNGVVKILIDEFNDVLAELAAQFAGRVVHVDCRGTVGSTANSWFDELHPKDSGYKRVAKLFADHIRAVETGEAFDTTAHEVLSPAQPTAAHHPVANEPVAASLDEAIIDARPAKVGPLLRVAPPAPAKDDDGSSGTPVTTCSARTCSIVRSVRDSVLEDGALPRVPPATADAAADDGQPSDAELRRQSPCTSLAVWQAHLRADPESIRSYNDYVEVRRRYDEAESEGRIRTRLELLPESDLFFQERIIGRSNLEQVNFLSRGERAARTVGRLSIMTEYGIPAGTGSGFLVAPGLLLTNNHVLASVEQARAGSYVLFDYEYDADNRLKTSERFELTDKLFITDPKLDFTIVSVAQVGNQGSQIDDYGRLRLIRESGKALKGEAVSIIQHPQGLPKQIAIRESVIVGRKGSFVYYYTDTNPGASGSPVLTDQWFPVALHHRSVPNYYETCGYVANRGVRISEIYAKLDRAADVGDEMAAKILDRLEQQPRSESFVAPSSIAAGASDLERNVEPFHELPYDNREGYDQHFLGRRVPMPFVKNVAAIAAPRVDTTNPKFLLTYEHFSLVMHRQRRLAIFTAANVDASAAKKRPEPGKSYSRKALGGLGPNDREKWFEDPRVSSSHQLPDRFFEKDGSAFDKGHLTMRAEVAWGNSYAEVQRANGDTFHTTNCSPQVKEFNRAIFGFNGLWGQLEEIVLDEAEDERLCVFAGPILKDSDRSFRGLDNAGELVIQIPAEYWKVIVARKGNGIETFAFVLEQDLSNVPLEFDVSGQWRHRRISVSELEDRVGLLTFPDEMHDSDGA